MTSAKGHDAHYKSRSDLRARVDDAANLRGQARYSVEVIVRNVSTGGFMAECPDPVRIGSYVALDVPGLGFVHAQVRWQLGGKMGGMFLDPIGLDRCEWTAVKTAPSAGEAITRAETEA
jgi:hypothetical protein